MDIPIKFDFEIFKSIISEIKNSRKGAAMIVFLICLSCAIFDFFLRKHGIVYDIFIQIYFPIGAISFTVWAIKVFNNIADDIEQNKQKKKNLENINIR